MKVNVTAQKKRNHTVTVPREYLECLEEYYEVALRSHFNLRGDMRKTPHSTKAGQSERDTLFLTDNELEPDNVIIVDEEGRETARYIKISATLDLLT